MEIHPPHGPITSPREFLIHLGTITAGILIALSLEGIVEWNHYRMLVHEARANIAREIQDNLKDLEIVLGQSGERKRQTDVALQFVAELLRDKKTNVHDLQLKLSGADLNNASWQTAERTGALAHMEYDEVKRYSHLYTVQEVYADMQRRNFGRLADALQIFADGGDPTLASAPALEAFRQQVLGLRSAAIIEEQIGARLVELYRQAAKE